MSPTAGWYPDPTDYERLRYWTGAVWTDRSAPAPPAPDAGAGLSPALEPPAAPGAFGAAAQGDAARITPVARGGSRRRYVLICLLAAAGGGLAVVLATRAVPNMVAAAGAGLMTRMAGHMGEGGCNPPDI